jgi:hypothetical protein
MVIIRGSNQSCQVKSFEPSTQRIPRGLSASTKRDPSCRSRLVFKGGTLTVTREPTTRSGPHRALLTDCLRVLVSVWMRTAAGPSKTAADRSWTLWDLSGPQRVPRDSVSSRILWGLRVRGDPASAFGRCVAIAAVRRGPFGGTGRLVGGWVGARCNMDVAPSGVPAA